MTNALTIYSQFDTMRRAATALHSSGYFKDAGSQAQAIAKVMAGAELGLPPFASMAGIHIVQGKPVLGSNVIATLVKNDPRYDYRVKQSDDTACVLEWYEDGQPVGIASFTMKEAQSAGLTSKDNWKKYPSDMLFARAISRGARRFAPGIFGGAPVYTPDEMNVDTDEEGYAVSPQTPTGITAVIQPWEVRSGPDNDELQGGNGYRPGDEIVRARKAAAAATEEGEYTEDDAQPVPGGPTYEDGTPVSNNVAERDSFRDYVKAHDGKAPANVHNLRNWLKAQKKVAQPALVDEPNNGAYQD